VPTLLGTWTYRSFRDDPDVSKPFNDIRFGAGVMTIKDASDGQFRGRLSFGEEFQLALNGWVAYGNPVTLRFQGRGDASGSEGWIYDYQGYLVPMWPNGVDQRPAIVGTIVRTEPHSGGQARAGVVASWIAVKTDGEGRAEDAMPQGRSTHDTQGSEAAAARDRLRSRWTDFYRSGDAPPPGPEADRVEQRPSAPRLRQSALDAEAPFLEPTVVRSQDGVLATELVVIYTDPTSTRIGDDPVRLRSYNGELVGPTLRARPGDTLRITLDNRLPEVDEGHEGHNGHHGWNVTNLHTHGLHVSPAGNSDNVLLRIAPGETFEYEIKVPEDHPSGTFWYHAHKHGSVAAQVASGMAGALVIEGGLDDVPEIREMQERVLVFQQIPYLIEGRPYGEIELDRVDILFGPGDWDRLGRFTTVNGISLPELTMRPGEIQRWRLIAAGFREKLLLELQPADGDGDAIPLHEVAVDGLPLGKVIERDRLELWPGYRSDVLIRAPVEPGVYLLVDERSEAEESLLSTAEERKYVARLVVEGDAAEMAMPAESSLAGLRPPSIDPGRLSGEQTQRAVYTIGLDPLRFMINGKPYDPEQSRTLRLGDAEEWVVMSNNPDIDVPVPHPFHIHVNPFEVVSILDGEGQDRLQEVYGGPVWRDTIILPEGWRIRFRAEYRRYIGPFVQHCHILDHEDQGMMELVEIVP
jgi:FtsP/CotA-like multicopper oxidase with cupredoxin domain